MTIKEIVQRLKTAMDDARGQESHFESWLTQNEGICDAIDALKELDKTEQEPVAFEMDWPDYHAEAMGCGLEDRNITDRYEAMQYGWDEAIERIAERLPEVLYTTPPQRTWVGLTDEEIRKWWASENGLEDCDMCKIDDFIMVARAIEAKLKEKNT